MYIKPNYKSVKTDKEVKDYNSKINPLSKIELFDYLIKLNLINYDLDIDLEFDNYLNVKPFPYLIKNVLPDNFAKKCQEEILNLPSNYWDRYENPFEKNLH